MSCFTGTRVIRTAGLIVYRVSDGDLQYLMLQSTKGKHHWSSPKGHLEADEDEWDAALRETREETGLTSAAFSIDESSYQKVSYLWRGTPKTIAFWLAEMTDSSIEVRLSKEHLAYRWLSVEEAAELTGYSEVADLLRHTDQLLQSRFHSS